MMIPRRLLTLSVPLFLICFSTAADEGSDNSEGLAYDPCNFPDDELRLPEGGIESDFLEDVPTDGVLLIPLAGFDTPKLYNPEDLQAIDISIFDSMSNPLAGSVSVYGSWIGNYWNRDTTSYLLWRGEQPFSPASEYSVQAIFDNTKLFNCP